jgi:hypothetical protein
MRRITQAQLSTWRRQICDELRAIADANHHATENDRVSHAEGAHQALRRLSAILERHGYVRREDEA